MTHSGNQDLIDRIGAALPFEVQADYFRKMMHCRSLQENDEMLLILRAMQFLTLLMTQVPERVVNERERLERRSYLTEVYRNALAREVRRLGYEIDSRTNAKQRDCGFEIRRVPEPILERYSQRSRQRDQAISRFIEEKGRPPTDNEIAILVRDSRADKLIEISTEKLKALQRARLMIQDDRLLNSLVGKARDCEIAFDPSGSSIQYAKGHVFERVSVARDHEILTEALRYGRGRISFEELKGSIALEESCGGILRHGDEIATKASLRRGR
jgi:hypothetical protein